MKTFNHIRIDKACRFCAKYSFILGSLIMLSFCMTGVHAIKVIGLIYLVVAIGTNVGMLFIVLIHLAIYPKHYLNILQSASIILFNVPVAIFYLWLVEELQNTVFQITTTI